MPKKNLLFPVMTMLLVLTLVLGACSSPEPTATPKPPEPTEMPTEVPTEEPEAAPEPTEAPVETAAEEAEPELDLESAMTDYLAGLPEGWGVIKVEALSEQLAEEAPVIVDVRQPEEYAEGHIGGAINIPLRELAQHVDALPGLGDQVVVYCRSGFRSAIGMSALQMLGYENAQSLAGGFLAWAGADLSVSMDAAPELLAGDTSQVDAQLLAAVDDYLMNVLPEGWGYLKADGLLEVLAEEQPFLLDVRQPEEFEADAIEGAINVPLRELGANLSELPTDQPIVAICGSGHRSTVAMAALQLLGYDVKSLGGGMKAYNAIMSPAFDLTTTVADYFAALPEGWGVIKLDALNEQMAEATPFLLDVRQPEEYDEAHIGGAVNIPLRELAQHVDALPGFDEQIVVYCKSGFRSAIGMTALQMLGYENAQSLAGGFLGWAGADMPISVEAVELATGPMPDVDAELLAAMDDYLMNVLPEGWGVIKSDGLLEALVEEPPFMLDVRQPEEFDGAHIDDALSIPLRELGSNLDQLPADRPIVAICGSGHRSTIAMTGLQILGYEVTSLAGGMNGYTGETVTSASTLDLASASDAYLTDSLPEGWGVIKLEALTEQMAEEMPFIVDVRQPEEYADGHVEGAINIPLRELAQNLDALPGMDEQIVVYCKSGFRSAVGMTALQMLGYEKAQSLAGGFLGWEGADLPVVTEPVELPAGEIPEVDAELLATVDNYLMNVLPEGWGVMKVESLNEMLVEELPFVVDVRQPEEFANGSIEGAVSVPLRELAADLDLLPQNEEIVLVCGSGHRSTIGMTVLQILGYEGVTSMAGGIKAWTGAELPLTAE